MKIAIIAVIIGVVALVVSIYVSNRKLEITKQSIEEKYPGYKNATSFNIDDAPKPNSVNVDLNTGVTKHYVSVKKYKTVSLPTEDSLNEMAKDGWKLVTIYDDKAYFEKDTMGWVENKGEVFQVK